MNRYQKSRVTVDFFMHERDILQTLCEQDIRPPSEQLRWLVLNEAQRRKLQLIPNKNTTVPNVYEAQHGGVTITQ